MRAVVEHDQRSTVTPQSQASRLINVLQKAARRPVLQLTLVALVLRALFVIWTDAAPSWDGVIYERAAEHLAHGEGYTQRILGPSAPAKATAFFPPGLAAVLAVLHRVSGGRGLDPWLQVTCCTLLAPLTYAFGRRFGGTRGGLVAGWLVALWPGGILLTASWFTEPLFALMLAIALLPLAYARHRKRTRALWWAALWIGLASYVRPTALVIPPLLGMLVAFANSRERAPLPRLFAMGRTGALALLCALLPLTPWVVRNQLALGEPVLVSTNGGFNLLLGTYGEGSYAELGSHDCPAGMREVEVDRCRRVRALERIQEDPAAWLARGVLKVTHTIGHDSAPAQVLEGALPKGARSERLLLIALAACRSFWLAFLGLFAGGFLWACRGWPRRPLVWLLALPIVTLLGVHFVYIGGDRYHAPLVPYMAAFAGLCWVRLFPRRLGLTR